MTELLVSDGTLYVGGYFEEIGGKPRANLAAVNLATGGVLSWNPAVLGGVSSLARRGPTIYVGGGFDRVGGQARRGLAAVNAKTGKVLAWDSNLDGSVSALAVAGSTVYAAGYFDTSAMPVVPISRQSARTRPSRRAGIQGPGAASARAAIGRTIYVAGDFSRIGGAPRNGLAALDAKSAKAGPWNPDPNEARVADIVS